MIADALGFEVEFITGYEGGGRHHACASSRATATAG